MAKKADSEKETKKAAKAARTSDTADSKRSKKEKPAKAEAKGKKDKKKGGIKKYFRDLRSEIKKVVWPSKSKVINNTGVVLTVMIVVGLFLFGIDTGLMACVEALLKIGS